MTAVFEQRRADPTLGVLETLLILAGEPVELDAHLDRLGDSVGELYAQGLHPALSDEIRERSRGIEHGKARITATSAGPTVECTSIIGDFCTDAMHNSPTAVSLHSLTIPGGIGPHKWADRSLLEEAEADLPGDALALIVDPDGTTPGDGAALEASRANLFAVRDGALFTPPLDSRILPGITRARVLALAAAAGIETHEAELTRADLRGAGEVFLSGSVRGIEPVRALDGEALAGGGETAASLGAELRRAWNDKRFG